MFRHPKRMEKSARSLETRAGVVDYTLKRSIGRRSLTICIDEQAEVSVSVPFRTAMSAVESFIHERSEWIMRKLEQAKENRAYVQAKAFDHGHEFLFLGRKYPINILEDGSCRRARIHFNSQGWHVIVPQETGGDARRAMVKRCLLKWYKEQAQEILSSRAFHYARIVGVSPKRILVRNQKRMWGCCDFNARSISLNWQILLSPMEVVDYVVVHELCHLIVPNHSARFWGQVRKVMPDFDGHRRWLKENFLEMSLP